MWCSNLPGLFTVGASGAAVCQKFNASDVPNWNYLKRGIDWPANTAWTCAPGVPFTQFTPMPMTSTEEKGTASTNAGFVDACLQVRRL